MPQSSAIRINTMTKAEETFAPKMTKVQYNLPLRTRLLQSRDMCELRIVYLYFQRIVRASAERISENNRDILSKTTRRLTFQNIGFFISIPRKWR